MTFREDMKKHLIENGMFENQAVEVMNLVFNADENKSMLERWDDDISAYPAEMRAVLRIAINNCALKWIDENLPNAWYRPIFLTKDAQIKFLKEHGIK